MNKNILAIAIAAAVAAPSAFAAATVYGVAHMGVAYQDGISTPVGDANGLSVLSNSSRIGIKGSEDLGAGLKALYQMEFNVNMDGEANSPMNAVGGNNTSASGLGAASRNTFVGLGGGFGAVLLGRLDSPIKNVSRKYDLFGDQIGNSRNILAPTAQVGNVNVNAGALVDGRHSNVIAYNTPKMGGFDALLAYVPGAAYDAEQSSKVDHKGDAYSAQLNFSTGAFDASLGYMNIDKVTDTTSNFEAYRLAASYTFGAAKVVALYQNDNASKFLSDTGSGTRDTFGLGGSYKVTSAGTIKAQVYTASKIDSNADKTGATLWNVGYDHALSKNTTVYANYALMDNDTYGAYSVNMYGAGSSDNFVARAGKDNSAFSVGLIHNF
jgi:predicted porin